jgi:hypothetical protein
MKNYKEMLEKLTGENLLWLGVTLMEEDYEDVKAVINRHGGGEQDLRNSLLGFFTDDNTYLSDNVKQLEYYLKLTEEGKVYVDG